MARNKELQKKRQREWYQRQRQDQSWYKDLLESNRAIKTKINELRPWARFYESIRRRCDDPKDPYFAKGIKNFLSREDLKYLWFRDGAMKLTKPSIDRKDSTKDYTLDNCRFIEWEENCKEGWFNSETGKRCRLDQLRNLRDGAVRSSIAS